MVVSTAEFMFNVEYFAGVRYVIADFGSKKIILDLSEWDELNKDDPLATIVFFFNFHALTDIPKFSHKDLSEEEFGKINRYVQPIQPLQPSCHMNFLQYRY